MLQIAYCDYFVLAKPNEYNNTVWQCGLGFLRYALSVSVSIMTPTLFHIVLANVESF